MPYTALMGGIIFRFSHRIYTRYAGPGCARTILPGVDLAVRIRSPSWAREATKSSLWPAHRTPISVGDCAERKGRGRDRRSLRLEMIGARGRRATGLLC